MALFSNQIVTYQDIKKRSESNKELTSKLKENFNIFVEAILSYYAIEESDFEYQNQEALIINAILDYTDDLAEELNVDLNRPVLAQGKEKIYNSNPYSETMVNNRNNSNFSSDKITNFVKKQKKKNRKKHIS